MLLLVLIAAKAGWAVSCALAAFRFAGSASAFGLAHFVLDGTLGGALAAAERAWVTLWRGAPRVSPLIDPPEEHRAEAGRPEIAGAEIRARSAIASHGRAGCCSEEAVEVGSVRTVRTLPGRQAIVLADFRCVSAQYTERRIVPGSGHDNVLA